MLDAGGQYRCTHTHQHEGLRHELRDALAVSDDAGGAVVREGHARVANEACGLRTEWII